MSASKTTYADAYRDVDFRQHPERYRVGKGEQGVLIAEPYKSEILPNWKFKTPEIAKQSVQKITQQFYAYKQADDFVGMDMARKFLQMGFTRARRYANHGSGVKYDTNGAVLPQQSDHATSEKARAAQVFYDAYKTVRDDQTYQRLREAHVDQYG